MSEDDFKCLREDFDNIVLELVKQKGFCPDRHLSGFGKFKEKLPKKWMRFIVTN